jgi:hypothetical protein
MEALAREATDDAEAGRFMQAQRGADRHAELPKTGQGGFQGDRYHVPLGDKKRDGQPKRKLALTPMDLVLVSRRWAGLCIALFNKRS